MRSFAPAGAARNLSRVLADEHRDELRASAITDDVIDASGLYTASAIDELPAWARWIGQDALPGLVFDLCNIDGSRTGQVKPRPGAVQDADGRAVKYISPSRKSGVATPTLVNVRTVVGSTKVVIVEGVKKALAALSWVPDDVTIYAITGIWSWRRDKAPTPELAAVAGCDVLIVADADAATNPLVYDGAKALGDAAKTFGAKKALFARLPASGKDGLDDVLAGLPDDDARRVFMANIWSAAKTKPADLTADELRRLRAERRRAEVMEPAPDGRERVVVTEGDPSEIRDQLAAALVRKAGDRLFHHGGALTRVVHTPGGVRLEALGDDGEIQSEIARVVQPVDVHGGITPTVVPRHLLDMIRDRDFVRGRFPEIVGVSNAPVVRPDFSVVAESGYDPATELYIDLDEKISGIDVPESPTAADVEAAVELLRDTLFALDGANGFDGWMFAGESSRANAVAAILTLVLRPVFRLAPAFVIDGIQAGIGKGALLDAIFHVAVGRAASLRVAPRHDDEMRKAITSALRDGSTAFAFDEAKELNSDALNAFLTGEWWTDRILGKTRTVTFKNTTTVFRLGNNVDLAGDFSRRAVVVKLSTHRRNIATRSNFERDLESWVPENRPALLRAVFVLIRAWASAGQPVAPKPFSFASFGEWQRIIGGILHHAGVEGFLENILEIRAERDSETRDMEAHLEWISELITQGSLKARFKASEVMGAAKADADAPPPHNTDWDGLNANQLSRIWGKNPRWFGAYRVRKDGEVHAGVTAYAIDVAPAGVAPLPAPAPSPTPAPTPAGASAPETIAATDRNGFSQSVPRVVPSISGPKISDLGVA